MGLAAGLGAFTAYDWWWAALLATVGVIAGAGIGFGWFAPLLMVPYAATFVDAGSLCEERDRLRRHRRDRDPLRRGARASVTAFPRLWMASGSPHPSQPSAVGFGAVMAASASNSASRSDGRSRTGFPSLCSSSCCPSSWGSATGYAGRLCSARRPGSPPRYSWRLCFDPPGWVLTALGVVVFVVALTQAKTYWLMYGLYTFALVMLLAGARPGWLRGRGTRLPNPGRHRPARPWSGRRSRPGQMAGQAPSPARTGPDSLIDHPQQPHSARLRVLDEHDQALKVSAVHPTLDSYHYCRA